MENVLGYVTTKDVAEAEKIGRALLEKKLAACVNILPGMRSLYWWEGKIETAAEAVLIVKTQARLFPQVEAAIKALHGYAVPCVLRLNVDGGSPEYLKWLAENVRGS